MNDLSIGDQRSSTTGQTKKPLLDWWVMKWENVTYIISLNYYELNLVEIVKGEYFNFKKRLSIDLLSSQMMNNDLSDKDQCFMSCVKIDDAINVIFSTMKQLPGYINLTISNITW